MEYEDSTVQSDAIGIECGPARADTKAGGLLLLAEACKQDINDLLIGPSSSSNVVRKPEYACNVHSDAAVNHNSDNKDDDDDDDDDDNDDDDDDDDNKDEDDEDVEDDAGEDGEENTSVSSVDSEYCEYFNFNNYPSLRNDVDLHYKYLKKELRSESLVLYNGREQIQLDDMLKQHKYVLACNIQRTFYFMCPPDGVVTRIQLDDPIDEYESYIKAHIDDPIMRPNVIIKDSVPDDYFFNRKLNTSSESDVPLDTEAHNDVKTLGDIAEKKTGKRKKELVANAPLIVAILQKKWYIVQTLLAYGADITCKSSSGRTAFHEAILHNWVPSDIAECLITDDNKDMQGGRGRTALHHLFTFVGDKYWKPRFDIVRTLCQRGADVNICDAFGVLPLHMALHCDFWNIPLKILELLVRENNVNAPDCFGHTPLHLAINNTFWEHAALFIEKGAYIDVEGTIPGDVFPFPLHVALLFAEDDVPSNLLEQLVADNNINAYSVHGQPLLIAIHRSLYENVRTLVDLGADINAMVDSAFAEFPSSLHAYMFFCNNDSPLDLVGMLASQNNINKRIPDDAGPPLEDNRDQTPILVALDQSSSLYHLPYRSENMYHCVPELIKAGADVNMRTKNTTPLLSALNFKDQSEPPLDIIKPLVSADIVNVSINNQTAFRRAFETGRWELIRVLLQYGADGPDVRGVVAAARTVSRDPHEGGRFDEQTNSLLDITVDIIRNFLPGFSDDDFCMLSQEINDINEDHMLSVKRDHLYCAIFHNFHEKSTPKEREDLMNLILNDYEDCTRL